MVILPSTYLSQLTITVDVFLLNTAPVMHALQCFTLFFAVYTVHYTVYYTMLYTLHCALHCVLQFTLCFTVVKCTLQNAMLLKEVI